MVERARNTEPRVSAAIITGPVEGEALDRLLGGLMKRNGQAMEEISDFAGLSRTNPLLAFFFAMLLFSLAGVPPLAGFFGKWYVFVAAIKSGLFTLAVIGVLTSVVGAFYYLTIVKLMYFDEPAGQIEPMRIEW